MKFAADVRGRRIMAGVATVAAAAAAVGLAVPAMAASAAPAARVLSGGQVASRSAVPWPKVGPGWALAEYSATQAGEGVKYKPGSSTLYLVNPQGGRYKLVTWPASSPRAHWNLLGWSGDVSRALFGTSPSYGLGPSRDHVYQLQLRTGRVTGFTLPAKVNALGYTRPDGLNILAEKSATATGTGSITVQRYSLSGKLQKNLVTFRDKLGLRSVAYNSKGTELAAGTANGLELISNAGDVIRKLPVSNESCTAVRWWSSTTVLASCAVTNNPVPQMWLVPASGARPTALTPLRSGGPDLGDFNAWKLSSGLYVDGYSGCGADLIGRQPAHGKEQIISIPGADSPVIVNATRSTLMIERHNACSPGTSLVWFNPATRNMKVAIGVGHHQVGVTAVVPYFIAGKF
jgi:TolB protein